MIPRRRPGREALPGDGQRLRADRAEDRSGRHQGHGRGAQHSRCRQRLCAIRPQHIHFRNKGDLQILVEGDKRMFNRYGVVPVNPAKHPNVKKELGQQFIDYLISLEGRKDISNYKINGEQRFCPNANDPSA
jgi:tungstate transport system substrate-binding protein